MPPERWRDILACPYCHALLDGSLRCAGCGVQYEQHGAVASLVAPSIARAQRDGSDGWDRWQEAIRGLDAWRARRRRTASVPSFSIDPRILSLLATARPAGFVLDVGGANGAKLSAMPAAVTRYLSIDPCTDAQPAARAGCEALSVRAVAEALPLPDAVADAVFSTAAMDYFVDPPRAVREFARVLRPNGTLALLVTVHPSPVALARAENSRARRVVSALAPSVMRSVGPRASLALALDSATATWREHTRYLTEDSVLGWLASRFETVSLERDAGSYSTVLRYVGRVRNR